MECLDDCCRLALTEMRVALAKLVLNYDVSPKDIGQKEPEYSHAALSAGNLEVLLTPVARN